MTKIVPVKFKAQVIGWMVEWAYMNTSTKAYVTQLMEALDDAIDQALEEAEIEAIPIDDAPDQACEEAKGRGV